MNKAKISLLRIGHLSGRNNRIKIFICFDMQLAGSTVLITGGGSGIGYALARQLVAADCRVIICGRRREQLEKARRELPELSSIECDVSSEAGRLSLFSRVTKKFPRFNILVNNAGIQHRPPPFTQRQDWISHRSEIATNFDAPLHLSMLFIPHLLKQTEGTIVNISSGLAFKPLSFMPTYCATKAALHSFTISLREQLKTTHISVVEVIPPVVKTDLGGKGLHDGGVDADEFAQHIVVQLSLGQTEIGYGPSDELRLRLSAAPANPA
jgi:uncharacterized oxidoreductase